MLSGLEIQKAIKNQNWYKNRVKIVKEGSVPGASTSYILSTLACSPGGWCGIRGDGFEIPEQASSVHGITTEKAEKEGKSDQCG